MSNTKEEENIDSSMTPENKPAPKPSDKLKAPFAKKEMEDRAAAVIVKLVSLSTEPYPLAQKVLLSYKFGASITTNITNLGKTSRPEAVEAALFLGLIKEPQVPSTDGKTPRPFKNRETLSHRIIKKIESLFPSRCSDCFTAYQPDFEDSPIFTCWSCYRHSHNCDVISELGEAISKIGGSNGFKWLCLECSHKTSLSLKKKLTLFEIGADPQEDPEKLEEEKQKNDPPGNQSQLSDIDLSQIDPSQQKEEEKEAPFERISRPCSFFRKGICRHGPDGTKEVDGRACRYVHKAPITTPKRPPTGATNQVGETNCQVFIEYGRCEHGISGKIKRGGKVCSGKHPIICRNLRKGAYGKNGCTKGEQCEFLHPKLCRGSTSKEKVCPNPITCKFFHTEGTRTRPAATGGKPNSQKSDDNSPRPYANAVNHKTPDEGPGPSETSVFLKTLVKEMKEGFLYQGQQIQQLMKALVQRDTSSPVKPFNMDHSGVMPDYLIPAERMGELQTLHPLAHRSQRSYF